MSKRPDRYLSVDEFEEKLNTLFLELGVTHYVFAARHPDSDVTITGNQGDPLWSTGILRVMEKDLYTIMKDDQEG